MGIFNILYIYKYTCIQKYICSYHTRSIGILVIYQLIIMNTVNLKIFSYSINNGYVDNVTGETFEPSIDMKLCDGLFTKFYHMKLTNFTHFPIAMFVTGNCYARPIINDPCDSNNKSDFIKRIKSNCDRLCSELEIAFQNVKFCVKISGLLIQCDSRTLKQVLINKRLHYYSYGTIVMLYVNFDTGSHVMDMNMYGRILNFLSENTRRDIYQVYGTINMTDDMGDDDLETFFTNQYLLHSISMDAIIHSVVTGQYIPDEIAYDKLTDINAMGYRVHGLSIHTSWICIDKYVFEMFTTDECVEYDYASLIESDTVKFVKPRETINYNNYADCLNIYVKFTIVLTCNGKLENIIVDYIDSTTGTSIGAISYADSKITQRKPCLIIHYFINDTRRGLNRPIAFRKLYLSSFTISRRIRGNYELQNVSMEIFTRCIHKLMFENNMVSQMQSYCHNITGEIFTFTSGSAVNYIDGLCFSFSTLL